MNVKARVFWTTRGCLRPFLVDNSTLPSPAATPCKGLNPCLPSATRLYHSASATLYRFQTSRLPQQLITAMIK